MSSSEQERRHGGVVTEVLLQRMTGKALEMFWGWVAWEDNEMSEGAYEPTERRPIKSREIRAIQRIASWLVRCHVSPNAISMTSIVFAAGAGATFAATAGTTGSEQRWLWLASALLIQLRLLANLFDGMVAVESGQASPLGELYNEVPDRVADVMILVGAGYAAGGAPELGYLAAIVALLVVYLRVVGTLHDVNGLFIGPMAKSHRMFLLTMIALYLALTPTAWQPAHDGFGLVAAALALVIAGGLLTCWRRLARIVSKMRGGQSLWGEMP